MIQRTLFNKFTIDRIEEVFVPFFAGIMEPQVQCWREAVNAGEVKEKLFYISINDTWEMDGIFLYDQNTHEGVIYARTRESAKALLERVHRDGGIYTLSGDPTSCLWVEEMDL